LIAPNSESLEVDLKQSVSKVVRRLAPLAGSRWIACGISTKYWAEKEYG
jgi:hypothetical protein